MADRVEREALAEDVVRKIEGIAIRSAVIRCYYRKEYRIAAAAIDAALALPAEPPHPVISRGTCLDYESEIEFNEEETCATAPSATNCAAQPATGSTSDTSTSDASTPWHTVIVGLPIIRKLLNGEDVTLESLRVNLIPDDVLWNGRTRAGASATPAPSEQEMMIHVPPAKNHPYTAEACLECPVCCEAQP